MQIISQVLNDAVHPGSDIFPASPAMFQLAILMKFSLGLSLPKVLIVGRTSGTGAGSQSLSVRELSLSNLLYRGMVYPKACCVTLLP